jgi:hypothetical protein
MEDFSMNSSIYTADRQTHLKVVVLAMFGATLVAVLAIWAHVPAG